MGLSSSLLRLKILCNKEKKPRVFCVEKSYRITFVQVGFFAKIPNRKRWAVLQQFLTENILATKRCMLLNCNGTLVTFAQIKSSLL